MTEPISEQPSTNGSKESVTRKRFPGLGSIYLRGEVWHVEYWHDNHQFRESSRDDDKKRRGTERDAIKLLRERHAEIARDEFISPAKDKITMGELLDAVKRDYTSNGHRSLRTLKFRLAPLRAAFGNMRAMNVTEPVIERYKANQLAGGKARATINRELATLRRAFRLGVEQKELSPIRMPRIRLFAEDNAREGFVDYDDFLSLVKHLTAPLDDIAWFGYLSGWRRGEILTLTWDDVDQEHGVVVLRAEFSKNKEPRELPLATPGLQALIARRWQARLVTIKGGEPKVCDLLFHRAGKPVLDFRDAWENACKAIGRPRLLFHDLRRSAVRNMVNAGVPERVAMRITGHKTRSIFDRYHIVDDRDVRQALQRTAESLTPHKTRTIAYGEAR